MFSRTCHNHETPTTAPSHKEKNYDRNNPHRNEEGSDET